MNARTIGSLVASLVFLACGSEDGSGAAENECLTIADAYARAWERCDRGSYDQTYDAFSSALQCEEARNYDSAAVDECVSDVDALTCPAVTGGATPNSCHNVGD